MDLPRPLTALESVAQIRFLLWDAASDVTGWHWPYDRRLRAWADMFMERERVVGMDKAWKDYR